MPRAQPEKLIIYSTPTCPYCKQAKEFFKEKNIAYEEKDVASDSVARQEMIEKSKQMGVPVIMLHNEIMVGFNREALTKWLEVHGK